MKGCEFNFSQRQKVLLLIGLVIVFLGVGIALGGSRQPVPQLTGTGSKLSIEPSPVVTPVPIPARLSLIPATATIKKGGKLTLSLRLNGGSHKVDALDVVLVFDPKVFRAEVVTPGKIFSQYPVKKIDNKTGLVQLSAAGEIKGGNLTTFSGEEEYGQVVFTGLSATSSSKISFGPKSIVAAKGKSVLDLQRSSGGTYAVK